jgi:hypothetical protein
MRANEILTERVRNLFGNLSKLQYGQQVWRVLQNSYASLPGGFGTASSLEELINTSGLWKVVTRDGKVSAVNIYRDQHGRKSIASGTDGTPQGKKDFMMIKGEDVKMQRAWAEVSGAPEKILARIGAKPIPAKYASVLTGKEILDYAEDGFHYTRLIAGHPHEKIMYGVVQVTPELEAKLVSSGVSLHDLPDSFKTS